MPNDSGRKQLCCMYLCPMNACSSLGGTSLLKEKKWPKVCIFYTQEGFGAALPVWEN